MNGWLAPSGEFFPCKPMEHNLKAAELQGSDEAWVHVCPSGVFADRPLTEAQVAWLHASTYNSQDWAYNDMVAWLLEKNGAQP